VRAWLGFRAHVIVRATEHEARAAAQRLISRLDDQTGEIIRRRSLDTTSAGTQRQNELREMANDDGYTPPGRTVTPRTVRQKDLFSTERVAVRAVRAVRRGRAGRAGRG
jgi:alkanesulfonate monooxygenase SsuD/methylene tetrahydromethanopterin reductase-like flavin-dependent oxidoreductase (luciferase family)